VYASHAGGESRAWGLTCFERLRRKHPKGKMPGSHPATTIDLCVSSSIRQSAGLPSQRLGDRCPSPAPSCIRIRFMSRCPSCDKPLDVFELERKITLPDGTIVPEEFCTSCLDSYVKNADYLDDKFYAHEHLTDVKYSFFNRNSENN
jgi:hypothetical protein